LGSGSLQEIIWGAVAAAPLGHRRGRWMRWPVGPLGRRVQRDWGIGEGQRWIRCGWWWAVGDGCAIYKIGLCRRQCCSIRQAKR